METSWVLDAPSHEQTKTATETAARLAGSLSDGLKGEGHARDVYAGDICCMLNIMYITESLIKSHRLPDFDLFAASFLLSDHAFKASVS